MCLTVAMADLSATLERAGERPVHEPGCRIFDKNGVSQIVGMMISGHKTASVYKRYRIVPENDICEPLQKVEQAINRQKKKICVSLPCLKTTQKEPHHRTRTNLAQITLFECNSQSGCEAKQCATP
jgi:hypothetical protein